MKAGIYGYTIYVLFSYYEVEKSESEHLYDSSSAIPHHSLVFTLLLPTWSLYYTRKSMNITLFYF